MNDLPKIAIVGIAIIVICYTMAETYKKKGAHYGLIPLLCGVAGVLLGLVAFIALPSEWVNPIDLPWKAGFSGGVLGALCTYIYEAVKGIRELRNEKSGE